MCTTPTFQYSSEAIESCVTLWGAQWAIVFLSALGLLGVFVAARLPDVSAH